MFIKGKVTPVPTSANAASTKKIRSLRVEYVKIRCHSSIYSPIPGVGRLPNSQRKRSYSSPCSNNPSLAHPPGGMALGMHQVWHRFRQVLSPCCQVFMFHPSKLPRSIARGQREERKGILGGKECWCNVQIEEYVESRRKTCRRNGA